ncbi:hypothetical protein Plhal304r1_c003g0009861 [Plasmopara halstedii]
MHLREETVVLIKVLLLVQNITEPASAGCTSSLFNSQSTLAFLCHRHQKAPVLVADRLLI